MSPNTEPPSSSTTAPIAVPSRNPAQSPPLDPSKLNQTPAPLPIANASSGPADPTAPLRSPETGPHDSSYLDTGNPETPSHPTVAETGVLGSSVGGGGPKSGQLKRNDSGPKGEREIIKLGSLGGEGLRVKPPVGSPTKETGGFGQ